jgi:BirA family transcriptional regulator, biotin operon repressor / biotin---[acetyl-CoA-carboxylase] ligase
MKIDSLSSELVQENFLSEIIYFNEIDSTNLYCKSNEIPDNTLILTSFQKKGIGRFGRKWESKPNDNLTFSLVKNFNIGNSDIHLVNFYSTYILYETFKKLYKGSGFKINLKWPNDVLMNNKKVAGLLLDVSDLKSEVKKFIIGIGVNVNQKEFPESISHKATSIYNETGEKQELEKLIEQFIKNFYSYLNLIRNKEELMEKWKSAAGMNNKKIKFKIMKDDKEFSATVLDIENDGGLKLQTDDGEIKKYYSGELSLVN